MNEDLLLFSYITGRCSFIFQYIKERELFILIAISEFLKVFCLSFSMSSVKWQCPFTEHDRATIYKGLIWMLLDKRHIVMGPISKQNWMSSDNVLIVVSKVYITNNKAQIVKICESSLFIFYLYQPNPLTGKNLYFHAPFHEVLSWGN